MPKAKRKTVYRKAKEVG
jgi:hypothetical protein